MNSRSDFSFQNPPNSKQGLTDPSATQEPSPKPPLRRGLTALILLAMILSGLIGGAVGAGFTYLSLSTQREEPTQSTSIPQSPIPTVEFPVFLDISTSVTDAVDKVGPAVVTVINHLPPRRTLFGEVVEQTTSGSGVIISPEGYIVTNHHVIDDAEKIEVILANGTVLSAKLIGIDPYGDLAVILAEGAMPAYAAWGNSDSLKPGETVIAIGSPLGSFTNSVTVGVISATGRSFDTGQNFELEGLIQTDAAINQGNSGGPLVNLAGQVVGVNTLIVRGSGAGGAVAEGLGFAIPSNIAREVAERLIADGYISRPFLGIEWGWITPEIAARFDLPVEYGVYLSRVMRGGPADLAGLKRGDILIAINDQPIDPEHPFNNQLFKYASGTTVTFTVVRVDERLKVEVRLGEQHSP